MTIDELINALEHAEGPSRELDQSIAVFVRNASNPPNRPKVIGVANCQAYTSSVDAALTLIPDGCDFGFEVEHCFGGPCVYARCLPGSWIAPVDDQRELVTIQRDTQSAAARMIPIALCIAALKARKP